MKKYICLVLSIVLLITFANTSFKAEEEAYEGPDQFGEIIQGEIIDYSGYKLELYRV
ncbi:MAG: hypothetical protein IJG59_06405 [Erysipelotrichaceae bacterium]|nr:hypothetical protein [Erysipelotrichaceae bacterium]